MIPKPLVRTVLERDNNQCVIAGPDCLGEASLADHRAPRGMGGAKVLNDPRVLIAACGLCNGWRECTTGADRFDLLERGVIVAKAATNGQTLTRCGGQFVVYPDGTRWFLRADGGRDRG